MEARFPDESYFFPRYPVDGVKKALRGIVEKAGSGTSRMYSPQPLITARDPKGESISPISTVANEDEEDTFTRRNTKYVDGQLMKQRTSIVRFDELEGAQV